MNFKKYCITTGLRAFFLSLLAISLWSIPTMAIGSMFIVVPIITLIFLWLWYSKKSPLPEKASEIFLPIFLVFSYYMCVWSAVFGLSNYSFDSTLFNGVFFILTIPYFVVNLLFDFSGDFSFFPFLNVLITTITVLTIITTCKIVKKNIIFDKKAIIYVVIFTFLSGIAVFQHYDRSVKILSRDFQVERIQDEINLYEYRPFSHSDKIDSKLKQLNEPPTISFTENYPKLDGATAAYPVYSAIAQELYSGLDEASAEYYVACSKTDMAYEHLINGEIDIFFGAQPSSQQIEMAKEKGIDIVLTPLAKEAFVFFVNKDNPVDSLTLAQIQDIYQKKITHWNNVGGNKERIMPFQRPENSGSQTIMVAMVMRDKTLPAPILEEFAAGMGGVINQVAEYRNYSSAIGYSFRYFATGMKPNDNIKLLAIDEIFPTVENIRNGTYPFTVDVYAITATSTNKNTEKLIQWILSEQGQNFIEDSGYVKI